MTVTPLLLVDKREGSRNLPPYLRALGAVVEETICSADVAMLGNTRLGPVTPIGFEHKSAITGDAFTSMSNGRLTGTQLPLMVDHYPAIRYVVIEGWTRRSKEGVLEIWKYDQQERKFKWQTVYSRNGDGWTYDEYRNRIESIEEFWSEPYVPGRTRVVETYDEYESAAFIVGRWHYWNKDYDQHQSARQWDASKKIREEVNNPLVTRRRDIPLAQLWAADLDGVGPKMSAFVARHFKSARALANATAEEWAEVEVKVGKIGQLKGRHFSGKTIDGFIQQIAQEMNG